MSFHSSPGLLLKVKVDVISSAPKKAQSKWGEMKLKTSDVYLRFPF